MATTSFPIHWAIVPRALSDLWRRYHAADFAPGDTGPGPVNGLITRRGATAIIPVRGALAKEADWFGPGMRDIGAAIEAAALDSEINAIVLSIDSPGGTVDGTKELADTVRAAAAIKPVVAYNDGLMASAAYWVGSQATRLISAPLSEIGSIGTLMIHADYALRLEQDGIHVEILRATGSPDKAKPNMIEPLDDTARADVTAVLDQYNAAFHDAVRAARPRIAAEALTGRVYTAENAPTGLLDQIGSFKAALEVARLLGSTAAAARRNRKAASAVVDAPPPVAQLTPPAVDMSDIITNVAAIYESTDFEANAIKLAARGSTENEIAAAYGKHVEAKLIAAEATHTAEIAAFQVELEERLTALEADHANALAAAAEAHTAELAALQTRLDEAEKARETAEARYQAKGFRAAEIGDAGETPKSKIRIIHYGD